ncbi:EAL domain-containing protein [Megalodesulfovibrio gigas]|nr:EAL domain-containing protein [Megalodesulfovibrio gigas]
MPCSRCEMLPPPLPREGMLYMAPPIAPTSRLLETLFATLQAPCTEACFPGLLQTACSLGLLETVAAQLGETLHEQELRDTKCLYLPHGEALEIGHLLRLQSLEQLLTRVRGEWLADMLAAGRIETWFQPIVHADAPQEVFAYECLMRGRTAAGALVTPGEIFSIARKADLLFQLDRACRLSAVEAAHRHGIRQKIFINFIPTTIYRPEACLQTTFQAIQARGLDPAQVVFEVTESEHVSDTNHLLAILDYYRAHGFRHALDDLGAGYSSLNLLSQLKPDFMKLDMQLIRHVDRDAYKAAITRNCIELARQLHVISIAEGVETPEELAWLQAAGVDYVQGFCIARPAPEPPMQ